MSDDVIELLGSSRPGTQHAVDGGLNPGGVGNPLVKGLVVLVMLAVATVVVAATDDDEGSTVAASGVIASAPLGPEARLVEDLEPDDGGDQEAQGGGGAAATDEPGPSSLDDLPTDAWAAALTIGISGTDDEVASQDDEVPTTTTEAPEATTTEATTTEAPEATTTEAPEATTTTTASAAESSTSDPESSETSTTTEAAGEETTTTIESEDAATTTTTGEAGDDPETPADWVDAGHGVKVPPVLLAIRWCESRDDYQAANPSSSARGAYQFLTGSWDAYGHADRYGVTRAHQATNAQQDEAALLTWQRDGTRPWNASKHCWSQRI